MKYFFFIYVSFLSFYLPKIHFITEQYSKSLSYHSLCDHCIENPCEMSYSIQLYYNPQSPGGGRKVKINAYSIRSKKN